MDKFRLAKWTEHPSFFLFYFILGIIALSFTFESEAPDVRFQLTSVSARRDLASTSPGDLELITQLERSKLKWTLASVKNFAISPNQVEQLEGRIQKQIPKRFKDNPVFQLLEKFSDDSTSTQYEDILACDKKRQYYENQILSQPHLGDLLQHREAVDFPQTCIISTMNHFNVPKTNYAFCARPNSQVISPAAKPCVTPNLVNLTYNGFMDITECLQLSPKALLPKIDFESGFFLNAYGGDKEGGVGQLTRAAIAEVNSFYDRYMNEVETSTNPACLRVLKYKNLLGKVPTGPDQRCSLMSLPENPMRNIFYTAIFNRINRDLLTGEAGLFKTEALREKLIAAGLESPDMDFFIEVVSQAGYNTGVKTAFNILESYLEKRIAAKMPVSPQDFDFGANAQVTDLDGEKRSIIDVARLNVMSAFVSPADKADAKVLKLKRRKSLPDLWKNSYSKTFPEYLAYNANSFDGTAAEYQVFGFPGYLSAISARNKEIRTLLENAEVNPNVCTDPDFLRIKLK